MKHNYRKTYGKYVRKNLKGGIPFPLGNGIWVDNDIPYDPYIAQPFGYPYPIAMSMEDPFEYFYEDISYPIGLAGYNIPSIFNGFFLDGSIVNIPVGHYEEYEVIGQDINGFIYLNKIERKKETAQASTSPMQVTAWTLDMITKDVAEVMLKVFGSTWKANLVDIATYLYTTSHNSATNEEKKISAAEIYIASCFVDSNRAGTLGQAQAPNYAKAVNASGMINNLLPRNTIVIIDTRNLSNLPTNQLGMIYVSTSVHPAIANQEIVIDPGMYKDWRHPGGACGFCDIKSPPDEVFNKLLMYMYIYLVNKGKTVYMISMFPINVLNMPGNILSVHKNSGPDALTTFVNNNGDNQKLLVETRKLFP